jgi:hypothetical protein
VNEIDRAGSSSGVQRLYQWRPFRIRRLECNKWYLNKKVGVFFILSNMRFAKWYSNFHGNFRPKMRRLVLRNSPLGDDPNIGHDSLPCQYDTVE